MAEKDDPDDEYAPTLGDGETTLVSIGSTWMESGSVCEQGSQTDEVHLAESRTQTVRDADAEAQTEEADIVYDVDVEADEALVSFLRRASERVEGALQASSRSSSSADDMSFTQSQSDATVESMYTLRPFATNPAMEAHKLICTSVSWSSTGNVLAASFGTYATEGWCDVPGALCTWNLARRGAMKKSQDKPDVTIELDNCLVCCRCHPAHPALVAGGTHNGEIYVWDLAAGRNADMQRSRSTITASSHREPVVSLRWKYSSIEEGKHANKEDSYLLISLGADGRVLLWVWSRLHSPVYAYELRHSHPVSHRQVIWGGLCLSFLPGLEDQGSCIIGTEGGAVFRCHLYYNESMAEDYTQLLTDGKRAEKERLRSPIKAVYDAHAGPVLAVSSSPLQSNIFATCGMDGAVRVYDLARSEPLLTLEPSESYAYGVEWSPFNASLIAVSTGDGCVHLYDLEISTLHPVKTFDVEGERRAVRSVAFNPRVKEYCATGGDTCVKVWSLGRCYVSSSGTAKGVDRTTSWRGRESVGTEEYVRASPRI